MAGGSSRIKRAGPGADFPYATKRTSEREIKTGKKSSSSKRVGLGRGGELGGAKSDCVS